jgi:hypothetical protein
MGFSSVRPAKWQQQALTSRIKAAREQKRAPGKKPATPMYCPDRDLAGGGSPSSCGCSIEPHPVGSFTKELIRSKIIYSFSWQEDIPLLASKNDTRYSDCDCGSRGRNSQQSDFGSSSPHPRRECTRFSCEDGLAKLKEREKTSWSRIAICFAGGIAEMSSLD